MWQVSNVRKAVTTSASVSLLSREVKQAWARSLATLNDTVQDAKLRNALAATSLPTKLSIISNGSKTAARTMLQIFVSVAFLLMLPMVVVLAMLRRKDVEYVVPKASKWYRTIPVVREPRINTHLEGEDSTGVEIPPGHVNLGEHR